MRASDEVVQGLRAFYAAFSSHDPDAFAGALAETDGVSVIGTAPGEGHRDRSSWIDAYRQLIPELGLRLEGGPSPVGFEDSGAGFVIDEPRFALPDGSFLPTRLTGVMSRDGDTWKVVHLHFSVGVPDEQAVRPAGSPWPESGDPAPA